MNILKAIVTVAGTAIGFAAFGGAVGAGLGKYAPAYYRQTFYVRDSANFEPIELGLGLGITQGLIWGICVGVLIVVILVWKEIRIAKSSVKYD